MSLELAAPLVEHFEGRSLKPYTCPAGRLTIGVGHVILPGEDYLKAGITDKKADELLADDLAIAARYVKNYVKVRLSYGQWAALVSFIFNVGGPAFRRSTLLRKLNLGDYAGASSEFERWNKAMVGGHLQPVDGLTRRRKCERFVFDGGTMKDLQRHNWFR